MWKLMFTKSVIDDFKKIEGSGLINKVKSLLEILKINPYQYPPPFEKLRGDLTGLCSRRINLKHRLVYQIYDNEKIVKIIRMWTHYE